MPVPIHAVLLVEDDSAVGDATSMMLEVYGYRVCTAVDGPGALSALADGFQPDLIIADYRLPGLNGVEVVRAVRQGTTASLPAIIVTGDTSARHINASGLTNIRMLRKPVDADHILALFEQWESSEGWQSCPE